MRYSLCLYLDRNAPYAAVLPELLDLLKSVGTKRNADVKVVSREEVTDDMAGDLTMRLREVGPQKRGDLVTSGGGMLPLSKSKKLNLGNTPILVLEKRGSVIDVFPKRIQDRYMDVKEALTRMHEGGLDVAVIAYSLEELARKRLQADPASLGSVLKVVGEEVAVEAGKIDLLLKGQDGRFLVIELERSATDAAVGQVIRLAASLAQREGTSPGLINKMIVCARCNDHVELAANSVGIKIHKDPKLFAHES